jgi:hypothetical protein
VHHRAVADCQCQCRTRLLRTVGLPHRAVAAGTASGCCGLHCRTRLLRIALGCCGLHQAQCYGLQRAVAGCNRLLLHHRDCTGLLRTTPACSLLRTAPGCCDSVATTTVCNPCYERRPGLGPDRARCHALRRPSQAQPAASSSHRLPRVQEEGHENKKGRERSRRREARGARTRLTAHRPTLLPFPSPLLAYWMAEAAAMVRSSSLPNSTAFGCPSSAASGLGPTLAKQWSTVAKQWLISGQSAWPAPSCTAQGRNGGEEGEQVQSASPVLLFAGQGPRGSSLQAVNELFIYQVLPPSITSDARRTVCQLHHDVRR